MVKCFMIACNASQLEHLSKMILHVQMYTLSIENFPLKMRFFVRFCHRNIKTINIKKPKLKDWIMYLVQSNCIGVNCFFLVFFLVCVCVFAIKQSRVETDRKIDKNKMNEREKHYN